MKKIVLICAKNYDSFACTVAEKIQQAADEVGIEISCSSMTTAELHLLPSDVDVVLFAPPRFRHLERIKKFCPNAKISMIESQAYATADGKKILEKIFDLK
ncbi:MAG: hypothetical protein IJT73_01335 [Selenomonadaceae bacterium]|nr:hypothetical protein [Selenomonadaceae bacterium]